MNKILYTLLFIFILHNVNCQIDTTIYEVKTDLYKTNTISGALKTIEWKSESMQELRKISIYEPIGFHKDSTYNVVITTDDQCEALANALESKMINNEIQPILIIGIHNREPQKIDSIFRGKEERFKEASELYIKAFDLGLIRATHIVRIGSVPVLVQAGNNEEALQQLDLLANKFKLGGNGNFINDVRLLPLHSDKRWEEYMSKLEKNAGKYR